MILKLNHLKVKSLSVSQDVMETVCSLVDDGLIDQGQFARLQVELDWIQYKHNFREPVIATQGYDAHGAPAPIMDIHVDARQVNPDTLRQDLLKALCRAKPESVSSPDRVPLEDFQSMRTSIVWEFNKFYWRHLLAWEAATGKGYDTALPGGSSDGHNPEAIAEDVREFLDRLHELESKNRLPAEINLLEIGVGSGSRCAQWLDLFKAADQQRGTNYYSMVHFHLGDYSMDTLEKAKPNIARHIDHCRFVPLDALNPIQALGALRHKILQVHLTNVYDNLPDEEVVRRDGRLYFVQVRAYVSAADAHRLCAEYGLKHGDFRNCVERMLQHGFEDFGGPERGVPFWQRLWGAMRLEERLVQLEDLPEFPFPDGLDVGKLEDILQDAPSDFRFHLSSGALESFVRTLPLLHPGGYLQIYDIFVTDLAQYRTGFFGPGKLDGSLLNWVNGALLREVAERSGYNVHFVPYKYRPGSKTTVLYTTRRE